MRKFKNLLMVVMIFSSTIIFAQTKLSGKIVDETNQPLPGASVVVEGTKTGASSDFDGNFSFETSTKNGTILVSFVGYEVKKVTFNGSTNFGTIVLMPSAETLDEIVVTATSFAIDRKTPIAVSTVRADVIQNKLGSQEFPEILKSTPGVYATKSGGGFGDGRLNLRGFNSENVAVLINGVPVNDMENGRVYWSNWAGLADVTSAMQVQRGLGAVKVAVPAIGGSINIISKTTDINKGGFVETSVGNDGYQKYGASVSTGLLDNGFAATVAASKTKGNGYVDGTEFEGYNYFVNISKQLNKNHKLSLTSFGAPQRHGQRQNMSLISTYRNAESGIKFNPDWGLRDGNVVHVEDNFYHKSQTSLNHYWTINEKSDISTALYASWGTGGGGGTAGNTALFQQRIGGFDQPIDIDNIVAINRERGALGAEAYLRASRNDHSWFGLLSTYKTELNENFSFVAGLDLRTYVGKHFSEVTDLLGADYAFDNSDINNPNAALKVGDKRDYYNDGEVGWQGLFGQIEYEKDNLAAFVSGAWSNTSYRRIDYFLYTPEDSLRESDTYNFGGFMIKGGANYNLTDEHNVFANIGYFEKAPGFDAVFPRYNNEDINDNAANQKIFSAEVGYGFRGETFAANVNLYRTEWKDRTLSRSFQNPDGTLGFANLTGVNALHQGIEIDFTYKPSEKFSAYGMLSLGDWTWTNNLTDVGIFDELQNQVATINLVIDGLKVSDAAQTTAALGFEYEVLDDVIFTTDFNYFADLYARYDPNSRTTEGPQAWKAPDYATFDISLRHNFKIGNLDATLIGRMNNVFDTQYIADAIDGTGSVDETALVWYGFGRTFNISTKIRF